MYALVKNVFHKSAGFLIGWAVGSVIAAILIDYLYHGRTAEKTLVNSIEFYAGGSIGVLGLNAILALKARRRGQLDEQPH